MLAAASALRQMGIYEEGIWGPYDSADTRRRLAAFVAAAGARHALRGMVYGQIEVAQ